MKDWKIGLFIFLILAIIISLFPPYEWYCQYLRKDFDYKVLAGKTYDFLFRYNSYETFLRTRNGEQYLNFRKLLIGELVIEYLLAGFIALSIELTITFVKRKKSN